MRQFVVLGLAAIGFGLPSAVLAQARLIYPVNSQERMRECFGEYGNPGGREFALCWRGELLTRREKCLNGSDLLGNPWITDWQKAQLFETMRNLGCMNG